MREILLISVQDNLSVIGLRYIHNFLLANGHRSRLLYLPHFEPDDRRALEGLKDFVSQMDPCLIGLSLMSTEFRLAREASRYLKRHFPGTPIVWGGVHPTIAPEGCLPFADYVCVGEGEKTALDLADALRDKKGLKEIPNLCYRDGGVLRKNPLYPLIEDLDALPFLSHIPVSAYIQERDGAIRPIDKRLFKKKARYRGRMYELMTTRGCAFSCTYCCNNFFSKLYASGRVRRQGIEKIISGLEKVLEGNPEIGVIHFHDDSFMSASGEYIRDFCAAYKDRVKRPFVLHTIPVYVNRDRLNFLKEAGLVLVNMGLQSGSDRVLSKVYKRNSLKKDFLEAAAQIKGHRIAGKYDIILDNPFETEDERFDTVEALIETPRPFLLEFYSLTFYPGTELHRKAQAECPEKIEDYFEKNYLRYRSNTLSAMMRIAGCLPAGLMRRNLRMYKADPRGIPFRTFFYISKILSKIYFRPAASIRTLRLLSGESYAKAFRNFPMYLKEAFAKEL